MERGPEHAVILQEKMSYSFDVWREELRLFNEVTRRILILDSAGIEYQELKIPYIGYGFFEEFIQFQAYTYNFENGKIKKTKLKPKDIVVEQTDKFNYVRRVKFPNVKPGSIIEYRYTIASLEIVEPRKWYFQHEIPVKYSEMTSNLPDFISYRFKTTGNNEDMAIENEDGIMNLSYIYHYIDPIPSGRYYRNRSFTTNINFHFQSKVYSFIMKNVPASKKEEFIDCPCNYLSGVTINLQRIDQKNGLTSNLELMAWHDLTKRLYQTTDENYSILSESESDFKNAPLGFIVFNANDWADVDKKLNKHPNFGLQLIKAIPYKPVFDEILENNEDDKSKMIKIYDYVRNESEWNGKYSIMTTSDLTSIFETKKGNSADINLLLISLLKKADLDVFPVILKTVDKGNFDEEYASVAQVNNVIALVKIGNKSYFLDASQKDNPWYALNKNNLNGQGRVIKKSESYFIEIENNTKTSAKNIIDIEIDNSGNINYKINSNLTGYFADESIKDDNYFSSNFLSNNFKNSINFVKTINENKVEFSGDFIEKLNGNSFKPFAILNLNTSFLSPYRETPVYFGYTFDKIYEVDIKIPENKSVVSIPENLTSKMNGASAVFTCVVDSSYIHCKLLISIEKPKFEVSEYMELRDMFFDIEGLTTKEIILE